MTVVTLYTDVDNMGRDFWKVGATDLDDAFKQRAARLSYNYINSCLDGFYTVPFTTIPPEIKDISDMITKGFALMMVLKRGGPKIKPGSKDNQKLGEIEFALMWLKEIALGGHALVGVTRSTARGPSFSPSSSYTRIFDLDNVFNHLPDPDYIDAVENERD